MNEAEKDKIIKYLKDTISANGVDYLSNDAFKVYEGLKDIKVKNGVRTSILCCLLNDISKYSSKKKVEYNDLYSYIKDSCFLNEEITLDMTSIFLEVFSNENKKEYENDKENGFEKFCNNDHKIEWEGFTRWYTNCVHLDCNFKANFSFKIVDKEKLRKDNFEFFNKNPYLTADFFYKKYKEEIAKEIDDDFEEYCTYDDYYPPVVEDYDYNLEDLLQRYCKEHGLKLISFEGEGETSNYERNYDKKYYF